MPCRDRVSLRHVCCARRLHALPRLRSGQRVSVGTPPCLNLRGAGVAHDASLSLPAGSHTPHCTTPLPPLPCFAPSNHHPLHNPHTPCTPRCGPCCCPSVTPLDCVPQPSVPRPQSSAPAAAPQLRPCFPPALHTMPRKPVPLLLPLGHTPAPLRRPSIQVPHPHFKRQGDDLVVTVGIRLDKALAGGTIDVPTLDNRILRIPLKEVRIPWPCELFVELPWALVLLRATSVLFLCWVAPP